MDPLSMLLLGAGTGGLKFLSGKLGADKKRAYEAQTARWSPWTGMKSEYVGGPSLIDNIVQGAGTGFQLGQNIKEADSGQQFQSDYLKILKSKYGVK